MTLASIIEALRAIPKILEYLDRLGKAVQKWDLEGDLKRLELSIKELENAQNLENTKRAVESLRDSLRKL